jgi:branched-chain amino acid transport system ATP-binding protein
MLLEVSNLTKRFGGVFAIFNLSMHVNEGEILGLIGPNGAGKTTFFNIVTGYSKPTAGRVMFKGKNVAAGMKPSQIARNGLIRTFQSAPLFQESTVFDNVLLGDHLLAKPAFFGAVFNTGSYRAKEQASFQRAKEILDFMGLGRLSNELARNLPYGYLKTLGVAVALAAKPELLLLDEPACGMNPGETEVMMKLVREIRDRGVTVVVVEHNMRAIMGLSDRVIALNFGTKIAEGLPQEIMENEQVITAYLGEKKYAA